MLKQMSTLMVTAFGLVAALAWNDAVQALFTRIFGTASGVAAKFVYATLVTIIIVFVSMRVTSMTSKLEKRLAKEKTKEQEPNA